MINNLYFIFQFDAEFRRFSLKRDQIPTYSDFRNHLESLHKLSNVPFIVSYTDPSDGDLLPINNDDNLARALVKARPLIRLILQRKGFYSIVLLNYFIY